MSNDQQHGRKGIVTKAIATICGRENTDKQTIFRMIEVTEVQLVLAHTSTWPR